MQLLPGSQRCREKLCRKLFPVNRTSKKEMDEEANEVKIA
jgi:hypothetical protein